ncbi:MAG: hypothetical protein NZ455_04780 [Bacteroidia bacterium]|nr:hypothetical protein [Bacteroidia bacterium]MDW8345976.1 hypothetical protein [Bacteroidia bacterium]
MSLAALGSGYSALRSRSVLRCASHCLTACSIALTQQLLNVLPCFYTTSALPCLMLIIKYLQS